MSIFVGKTEVKKSKDGKTYQQGWIGNSPVLGHLGTKEGEKNIMYWKLDDKKIDYLVKKGNSPEQPQMGDQE